MVSWKQIKALAVRAALALHFVLVVWRVTEAWTVQYWLLAAAILPFLLEAVFTVARRDGVEWKLFSLCFFFYLCATLPGIWLLEIKKTTSYQNQNTTELDLISVSGIEIPVRLSPDTWVLVVEELMLYLMILGRWMLPRGDVGREQLTQLLFGFIGIASDIMELFSLFDEGSDIRHNTVLTYIILGVWSLSVLQFTLTFATAHRPRRARGLRLSPATSDGDDDDDHHHRQSVIRVELLATVLSLLMQDGPFLAVRLYTMITYNIITYSLVFFTAKNVLVILLLAYKILLLLNKICCPKKLEDDDDGEGKEKIGLGEEGLAFGEDKDWSKTQHKSRGGGRVADLESGELRKRKEDKKSRRDASVRSDFSLPEFGDLQKVIDGPATPAKSMQKSKKYKHVVQEETSKGKGEDGDADLHCKDAAVVSEEDLTRDLQNTNYSTAADTITKAVEPTQCALTTDEEAVKAVEDLGHISDDSGHQESPASECKPLDVDMQSQELAGGFVASEIEPALSDHNDVKLTSPAEEPVSDLTPPYRGDLQPESAASPDAVPVADVNPTGEFENSPPLTRFVNDPPASDSQPAHSDPKDIPELPSSSLASSSELEKASKDEQPMEQALTGGSPTTSVSSETPSAVASSYSAKPKPFVSVIQVRL